MTMYQEFADDIELRRRRLARQQWLWRCIHQARRLNLVLTAVFLLAVAAYAALLILRGLKGAL